MLLYLVQHGKANPKEVDPERGLTEEGKAETERVAARAAQIGLRVSEIVHSGKKRARDTAVILARRLGSVVAPTESAGLEPGDEVEPIARWLAERDGLMIVGHLPFLERLAAYLIVGDPASRPVRFANSGIVCLELAEEGSGERTWALKWALTPELA